MVKQYNKENRKGYPQAHREAQRAHRHKIRRMCLEAYGNKCACCGEDRYEFLAIDHTDGNGSQMRKVHGVGQGVYYWLIKNNFPPGFRVLCHNCNMAFGFYGYCPHNKEGVRGEAVGSKIWKNEIDNYDRARRIKDAEVAEHEVTGLLPLEAFDKRVVLTMEDNYVHLTPQEEECIEAEQESSLYHRQEDNFETQLKGTLKKTDPVKYAKYLERKRFQRATSLPKKR